MIISASRRTDIPAFYSEWLFNRVNAGYAITKNPFNLSQIRRVSLKPEDVDCFVFWTKDPYPMLPRLGELEGYFYYFLFTLTPYGKDIERNLRDKAEIEDTFVELSRKIGKNCVVWRYDPIILSGDMDIGWHSREFTRLCEKLAGFCDTCVISFADVYAKLKTKIIRELTVSEMNELAGVISTIAGKYRLRVKTCCEQIDLTCNGITQSSCIDAELITRLTGKPVVPKRDRSQRPGCNCAQSVDIGAYNTCPHGCVYCYANHQNTAKNAALHNPLGETML